MRKSIVDVQQGELHMTHDEVHKARVLASIKREETKRQSRDNKPRQVRYRRYPRRYRFDIYRPCERGI